MFKMLCGTEPHPKDIRAKKYRVDKHFLTKEDFVHIMKNLPVPVDDEDIEEMFEFADKNKDGKLSYKEFKVMVNPPEPPAVPKPHISDLGLSPQVFSPEVTREAPSNFASPILPSRGTSFHSSMTSITTSSKKTPITTTIVKVETGRNSNNPLTSL